MKKIGILFLAVGLMGLTGLAAEAAAPVSRTLEFRREMMRKNAYLGEWQEVHGDESFTLSFATNEVAVGFPSERKHRTAESQHAHLIGCE